jgi:hypothetical protein
VDTLAFLKHIEAELVGSRFKAILDGVHTFVADIVDHNPILTAAGLAAKEELMAKLPATAEVVKNAVPAINEVTSVLADPASVVGGAATGDPVADVAAAVVKPAAEKAAVDAVDAALDALTATVSKRGKKAAATPAPETKAE